MQNTVMWTVRVVPREFIAMNDFGKWHIFRNLGLVKVDLAGNPGGETGRDGDWSFGFVKSKTELQNK